MSRTPEKKALTALFMVVFIDLFGFGMVIPLLPQIADAYTGAAAAAHAKTLLGNSPLLGWLPDTWLGRFCHLFFAQKGSATGWLLGLFSLMQFIFSPFWGSLSDRYGRKPLLVFGLLGNMTGHAMFALSTAAGPLALLWMYASRIVTGISGANMPVAQAYIADHTEPAQRAKAMGLIGAAFGLGFIFGPALGGILAEKISWGAPFWLASGLSLVSAAFAQTVLKESDPARRRAGATREKRMVLLKNAWNTPGLKGVLLLFFLIMFGFTNMEVSFVLFAKEVLGQGRDHIGYLFFWAGAVIAFTQGFAIGKLRKRFHEATLIRIGACFMALALGLMPLAAPLHAGGFWMLGLVPAWLLLILLCLFGVAFGNGISNPSLSSYLSRRTPENVQGGVLGAAQSLASLARVLGPIFAGQVFNRLGHARTLWVGSTVMALGVLVAFSLLDSHDHAGPEISTHSS